MERATLALTSALSDPGRSVVAGRWISSAAALVALGALMGARPAQAQPATTDAPAAAGAPEPGPTAETSPQEAPSPEARPAPVPPQPGQPDPIPDPIPDPVPDPQAPPCLQLRHNPCPCECFPFEVRLGARWVRVHLVDKSDEGDLVTSLQAAASRGPRDAEELAWWLEARVRDSVRRCALGHPHPLLDVRSLCPDADGAPVGQR